MATVLAYRPAETGRYAEAGMPGLSDLIELIGLEDFGRELLAFFDRSFGADHCAVYQLRNYELAEVTSISRADSVAIPDTYLSSYEVKRRFRQLGPASTRVDLYRLSGAQDYRLGSAIAPQSIMIFGSRADTLYCVRVLRVAQDHEVTEFGLSYLREIADMLISLVARHHDLILAKPSSATALSSLKDIQNRILGTKSLSRREGEVCARILYGYSSCGIALDLGIGKESVMTYRKRAYHHLGIGSQRELLLWYLEQAPDCAAG